MRVRRFEWTDAGTTALDVRNWAFEMEPEVDVEAIAEEVIADGDDAIRRLTALFDATERSPASLRVAGELIDSALARLDPAVREAMEIAAENIRVVAEAQMNFEPCEVTLPQGQTVGIREIPVGAAALYVPGGRAFYPSSVLMGCIPARVAGVERIVVASPPGPDGRIGDAVLAATALCGVDEVYAMGGAHAIFALAYGTGSIVSVDVIAGPGNAWVQAAKNMVSGAVGVDSFAGPSELMVVADSATDAEWAALDLCAQAEHGPDSPLLVVATSTPALEVIAEATVQAAAGRPGVANAPLALVEAPDLDAAVDLANAFAPEHLELLAEDAALLADRVTTAGCVFAGRRSATAFGDYVAGSNHVLPTGGAGRFSGPLGPDVFRRKIATVEIPPDAAAKLAPHVDALARVEGFPVHGESAMIRR